MRLLSGAGREGCSTSAEHKECLSEWQRAFDSDLLGLESVGAARTDLRRYHNKLGTPLIVAHHLELAAQSESIRRTCHKITQKKQTKPQKTIHELFFILIQDLDFIFCS